MRSVDDYLDLARNRQKLPSDRQLCAHLKCTDAVVSQWRKRKSFPSDEHMVRLAELAGLDPQVALLELACWRAVSRNENVAVGVYKRLLERVTHTAAAALVASTIFAALPDDVMASTQNSNIETAKLADIYIMRFIYMRIAGP